MMIRVLLASSSALLLGSIGAFFLFVPVLSIATVICLVAGLMLMFGLGFQMGPQEMLPQTVETDERTRSFGLFRPSEIGAPATKI